jgi:regulator of cell morphogenesis and NO signaling
MHAEHERVGALLKDIRRLSQDFAAPDDACPSFRTTYQALEGLEADLMRHIHLENNVLFPRARQLAGRT